MVKGIYEGEVVFYDMKTIVDVRRLQKDKEKVCIGQEEGIY